jgi:hypothetical protein
VVRRDYERAVKQRPRQVFTGFGEGAKVAEFFGYLLRVRETFPPVAEDARALEVQTACRRFLLVAQASFTSDYRAARRELVETGCTRSGFAARRTPASVSGRSSARLSRAVTSGTREWCKEDLAPEPLRAAAAHLSHARLERAQSDLDVRLEVGEQLDNCAVWRPMEAVRPGGRSRVLYTFHF